MTQPEVKEGLLLFDKPAGWTSHDVVKVSRKYLRTKKIGHSGTLDPMATGLLILLIGRSATKRQNEFLKLPKRYSAVLKLGEETDTLDADGAVTNISPVPMFGLDAVVKATEKLTGTFEHLIPKYSAKKFNGRAMHKLAREEVEVPEQVSTITVFKWDKLRLDGAEISFEVEVSSGTYVRSLALMLARSLGTVGHLNALRRLSISDMTVCGAMTMEQLKTLPYDEICRFIK